MGVEYCRPRYEAEGDKAGRMRLKKAKEKQDSTGVINGLRRWKGTNEVEEDEGDKRI